jgi:Domain of unknown function (DUF4260)
VVSLQRVPGILLRVEGWAVFAAAVVLYLDADYSVLALVLLFLVPDVSMVGYLVNPRAGSTTYNAVHTYVGPVALLAIGLLAGGAVATQLALIWLAHIGVDRALGYGLKYPSAFKDTHLQRV